MIPQNKIAEDVLRLDREATPWPWTVRLAGSEAAGARPEIVGQTVDGEPVEIAEAHGDKDAELIAAWRTDAVLLAREVLRLLGEVDRIERERREEREAAREGRRIECDELERQLRQCQGELLTLRTAAQKTANDRGRIERERDQARAALARLTATLHSLSAMSPALAAALEIQPSWIRALEIAEDTAYRPGLPTVEQVRGHEARGGLWQVLIAEGWVANRGLRALPVGVAEFFGSEGWLLADPARWLNVKARPCTTDGTPCSWSDL